MGRKQGLGWPARWISRMTQGTNEERMASAGWLKQSADWCGGLGVFSVLAMLASTHQGNNTRIVQTN
jgi:hypothetical protein